MYYGDSHTRRMLVSLISFSILRKIILLLNSSPFSHNKISYFNSGCNLQLEEFLISAVIFIKPQDAVHCSASESLPGGEAALPELK